MGYILSKLKFLGTLPMQCVPADKQLAAREDSSVQSGSQLMDVTGRKPRS